MNRAFPILVVCLLVGCVSAPTVQVVPDIVQEFEAGESHERTGQWWQALGDKDLDGLIALGLADSPSAQIALARLGQAEESLKVAQAARWPALVGLANRDSRKISGPGTDTRADLGVLELTWDVGLWGKRRLEIQEASEFRAQRWFEHQAVQLSLSSAIADIYYQIIEQRIQRTLLAAQLEVSRNLEDLIEERFRRGQARASELYQQKESTASLVQFKVVNDTNIEVLEKSLDVLLGQVPDTEPRVASVKMPSTPERIHMSGVEDLVRYRADIRAGFSRLKQVAARAGVQFAERLPSLQVSANLTSLAQKTMSTEWFGHGLDLRVPIFTGGELGALEAQALYALEEERQRYLEVWLAALEEVSSLYWQFDQQRKVIETLEARRGFAEQALNAARNRYVLGDQNYLDVLTALRGLQETDRLLVAERRILVTLWVENLESIGQHMCADLSDCEDNWRLSG